MPLAKWVDYRLFAYERRLAEAELRALGATSVVETEQGLSFAHPAPASVAARATFFATIATDDAELPCAQRDVELEHLAGRARAILI